ncbi:SH3 domain-containing protein [Magnetospira sp. QH-2]|uniref:SH3 domain-containing protein n=1 Tax=Magnetospira sp. (strain QH-2) TaxID=1288970 RepID=UPI0003E80D69|nr:SH3 domain-containing protein [Magnetospira sp. QH-2]CCQ72504.1 protein of unknown function [Magnetospira sp. QH-2]
MTGMISFGQAVLLAVVCLWSLQAFAQDPAPVVFMEQEITHRDGMFVISQTGNLRAAPNLKGKKLGKMTKGDRVSSPGHVKQKNGTWYAIRQNGKDLGFVFETLVLPVIDGSLASPLTGDLAAGGGACFYEVHYQGRTEVEGAPIQTADYDLILHCSRGDKRIRTQGFMFLTESPYNLSRDPLFQISVDILDIHSDEEPPSVATIWNRRDDKVIFESIGPEVFAREPDLKAIPAEDLTRALVAAIELATSAWNEKVWSLLPENGNP